MRITFIFYFNISIEYEKKWPRFSFFKLRLYLIKFTFRNGDNKELLKQKLMKVLPPTNNSAKINLLKDNSIKFKR